jgi:hypothetical protein
MKNSPNVIKSSEIQKKLIETIKELNNKCGLDLGAAIVSDCRLVLHLLFRSDYSYDISENAQNASKLYRFLRDTWIMSYENKIPMFKEYSDNFDLKDLETKNTQYFESYYLAYRETPEKRDHCLKIIDSFLWVFYDGLDIFNPHFSSPDDFYNSLRFKDFDYIGEIKKHSRKPQKNPDQIIKDYQMELDQIGRGEIFGDQVKRRS